MLYDKFCLIIIFSMLFMPFFSALRINEAELNPAGTDAGGEWIELYSEDEIDLSEYKLVNNDVDELTLGGTFSGYYVYAFERQWLDNSDEKIFLYRGSELIDETGLLNDDKNDGKTWNYCYGWELAEQTKSGENICEKNEANYNNEKNNSELNPEEDANESKIYENKSESSFDSPGNYPPKKEPAVLSPIKLNPKDIKDGENSESLNNKNYAVYSFIIFCILLAGLFAIRRYKYKNEF